MVIYKLFTSKQTGTQNVELFAIGNRKKVNRHLEK
jgi:hypothetical protein